MSGSEGIRVEAVENRGGSRFGHFVSREGNGRRRTRRLPRGQKERRTSGGPRGGTPPRSRATLHSQPRGGGAMGGAEVGKSALSTRGPSSPAGLRDRPLLSTRDPVPHRVPSCIHQSLGSPLSAIFPPGFEYRPWWAQSGLAGVRVQGAERDPEREAWRAALGASSCL